MGTKRKREIKGCSVDLYLGTKLTIRPQDVTIQMQNITVPPHPTARLNRTII